MHHVNRLRPQVFALQLNDKDMNILDFNSAFPDEHSCRMDMKEKREAQGIVCKKCSCKPPLRCINNAEELKMHYTISQERSQQ